MKIIDTKAFEEAQYMAELAVYGQLKRIPPECYWFAAMESLREAYGK